MEYVEFLIRLCACFVFGCAIGLERQWRHRLIGLRTNVLVCLGAFLFVTMSMRITNGDTTRIAAQVVSGIGFLGAGVILRDGVNVKGLNTAATLWCVAAIGVLCASGFIIEAAFGTIFILFSNSILRLFASKIINKKITNKKDCYVIRIVCEDEKEVILKTLLTQKVDSHNLTLTNLESTSCGNNKVKIKASILISANSSSMIENIINRMSIEPGVTSVGWSLNNPIEKDDVEDDDE